MDDDGDEIFRRFRVKEFRLYHILTLSHSQRDTAEIATSSYRASCVGAGARKLQRVRTPLELRRRRPTQLRGGLPLLSVIRLSLGWQLVSLLHVINRTNTL